MRIEREKLQLSLETVAAALNVSVNDYVAIEEGQSQLERFGPLLGRIAVNCGRPMSRFISATGKASDPRKEGVGAALRSVREELKLPVDQVLEGMSQQVSREQYSGIEHGGSGIDKPCIQLLAFANLVQIPVFNFVIDLPVRVA